ncbi:MAG: hypothetical protein R2772_02725 [Chitinophagales bacterium]
MNRIFILLITLFISATLFAQVPNKINYQSIIRDSNGMAVMNQAISIKIAIKPNNPLALAAYSEIHNVITNDYGLVNLIIGTGQVSVGSFNTLNWESGIMYVETSLDLNGGTNFVSMGTQQLITVPYAFVAQKSIEDLDNQMLFSSGNNLSITGGNSIPIDIDTTNEIQNLTYSNSILSISQGNSVTLPSNLDNDPTNELQSLSFNNDTLFISDGNHVVIPRAITLESPNGTVYELTVNDNGTFSTTQLCNPGVAQANAGADQSLLQNTTYQLAANIPAPGTTGQWTKVSGGAGSFSNANSYNSTFTGVLGQTYILRWTLTNSCGSSYDDVSLNFTTFQLPSCNCQGQTLYAFPSANSTSINWGSQVLVGPTAQTPNDGEQNTNAIIANNGSTSSYAPQLCYNLIAYGYSDWYLPSKDELNCLYTNGIGSGSIYMWNSTEYSSSAAWVQNMSTGSQFTASKINGNNYGAKCVRKD